MTRFLWWFNFFCSRAFGRVLVVVGAIVMASGFMTLGRRMEAASVESKPTPFSSFNPRFMQEVTVRVVNLERGWYGSGLVVSKDGLVATTAHLVEGAGTAASTVYVELMRYDVASDGWSGSEARWRSEARIVRVNFADDVALIRMVDPPSDLVYGSLASEWDSLPLQSEDTLYYVALGSDGRIDSGQVLAPVDRTFSATGAEWLAAFSFDWYPRRILGGAPVFDAFGRPIGLIVASASSELSDRCIGYVVPLEKVRKLMRP